MSIYIYAFIISSIMIACSERVVKKQRWILVLPALLIPCIIAGFRAQIIGTDTEGYLVPMIKAALSAKNFEVYLSSKWFRIWRYLVVKDYEIGFSIIVYLITRITHSIFAVQFFIQLLTILPIYLAVNKTKYSNCICVFIYYFMFFNGSLNMIRQMVAVSFCLLAIVYLSEDNVKKFIVLSFIAFLFHYSAVLIFLISYIYKFVQSNKKNHNFNMCFVIILSILCVLSINIIIKILPIIGLGRYINYLIGSSGGLHFMPLQFLIRLPIIVLFLVNWNKLKIKEKNLSFYFTMLSLDTVLSQLISINSYSGRITVYFSIFGILSYASLYKNAKYKYLTRLFLMIYLIFYWWYFNVLSGINATVPYLTM